MAAALFGDGPAAMTDDASAPTAEWYHLRNGKISAVRVFFDARPFAPMFERKG